MSKQFLTVKQANAKLGITKSGNSFIKKSELIATGKCDTTLLTKYSNNNFVIDDDIVKKDNLTLRFTYSGGGDIIGDIEKDLPLVFNPSKNKFRITGRVRVLSSVSSLITLFIIYDNKRTYDYQSGCVGNLEIGDGALLYSNWRDRANSWVNGKTVGTAKTGEYYNFEITYDGTTLVRKIYNDSKSINLNHSIACSLYNYDCNAICFNGTPFYGARDCKADFANFEFYY